MKITTIGIDLAKEVFQIHGIDDELLSNLVYRESSDCLFLISCLFDAVYKFNAVDDIR